MEGVGARFGRSSTRYGPATVFSGPVRKWKKTWVPLSSSTSSNNPPSSNTNSGNCANHLLLYKWTPLSNSNSSADASKDDGPAVPEEVPPRRKFKYVPVKVIEELKGESSERDDDETKASDAAAKDPISLTSKKVITDGKPDFNDAPMEDTEALNEFQAEAQLNETNLDLSLGLKAHDGDLGADKSSGRDVEMKLTPEPQNRSKRKSSAPDLEMRVVSSG